VSEDTVYHASPGYLIKDISLSAIIEEIYVSNTIFTIARGQEICLPEELVKLDATEATSVWIQATDGLDGEAARGLTHTLCKEFPTWNIRLVVFDPSWSPEQRRSAITKLQEDSSVEPEVKIDANGSVYVPRVIPLPSSSRKTAFDTSKPWMVVDGKAVLTLLPPLGPFDITVDVSHWSSLDAQSPRASSISMQAGLG